MVSVVTELSVVFKLADEEIVFVEIIEAGGTVELAMMDLKYLLKMLNHPQMWPRFSFL